MDRAMQGPSSNFPDEEGMPSPTSNHQKTALEADEESEGLLRVNIKESEGLPVALLNSKLVRVRVLVNNFAGSGIELQGLTGRNTKCKAGKKNVFELENNDYEKKVLREVKGDGHTKVTSDTRLCSSKAMKNAATNLVCKKCAIDNREKSIVSYADGFDKYIEKHASKADYKVPKKMTLTAFNVRSQK